MDIAELIKLLAGRGDLLGAIAAVFVVLAGMFLKLRADASKAPSNAAVDAQKIEKVFGRIDGIDKRLARVESDVEHLPTRAEFHKMEIGMAKLSERVVGIERTTESTSRAVGRIEDFMISMKRNP